MSVGPAGVGRIEVVIEDDTQVGLRHTQSGSMPFEVHEFRVAGIDWVGKRQPDGLARNEGRRTNRFLDDLLRRGARNGCRQPDGCGEDHGFSSSHVSR